MNFMKAQVTLIAIAMAASANAAKLSKSGVKPDVERQEIALTASEGKRAVVDLLRDPMSALFRNSFVSRMTLFPSGQPGMVLCGEVNSKNGYGGYVGFSRFYSFGKEHVVIESPEQLTFAEKWHDYCTNKLTDVR
jgi:hypothetical protein